MASLTEAEQAKLVAEFCRAKGRVQSAKRMIETALGAARNDLADADVTLEQLDEFMTALDRERR